MNTTATGIRMFSLVFLITGAIDSIRNLPSTALFGNSLIFFFFLSSVLFLIPIALISATLSACWPDRGGIYSWVRQAFGDQFAFIAIWLQWINTLIWLPTILSFLAGTSAYLVNPVLALNKYYLISVMFFLNVLLTIVNLRGIRVSAQVSTFCAIVGTILPILFIISLGIIWLASGNPTQIHLSMAEILPDFSEINSWISLTAIFTSFLGIELATVHIRDVHDPQRTFPKALAISVVLVIVTIFLGAMSIALVLPNNQIGLVNGIAETFSYFLNAFKLSFLLPYILVTMLIGSFGGIISWIISPTRGFLQVVESGYMPAFFAKLNKHGAPSNLLITQSVLVFALSLGFLLVPSVNGVYWFLTDLSTQLYVMMYVIMFISALVLLPKVKQIPAPFKIPGGQIGYVFVCCLGLAGCMIALVIGFFPPKNIIVHAYIPYQIIFGIAMLLLISPVALFVLYHHWWQKKSALQISSSIIENI